MTKYETTNTKYYFNDADLNTRAFDIDTTIYHYRGDLESR